MINNQTASEVPEVLESKEEINEKIVSKYKALIFDMDGVIWRLNEPVQGAKEALQSLSRLGKYIFFVTNNSTLQSSSFVEKLSRLNLGTFSESSVLGSSWAAAQCLKSTGCKGKVYMIGPPALRNELEKLSDIMVIDSSIHNHIISQPQDFLNTKVDTEIQAVVMGFDQHLNYYKIAYASALLNSNPKIHLIFTNADHQFPTGKYVLPGNGAFISTLQVATGRQGIIAGKPGPLMINEVLRQHPELSCEDICIIGDNLDTDIPFGNFNGLCSILVETGIHKRQDVDRSRISDKTHLPRYIIPSIAFLE